MNATNHTGQTLAGLQSHRCDARIAERRLRVALQRVIADPAAPQGQRTPTPDHAWYDNSRKTPRAPIVCEKEREMLHAAIAQGCTTPLQIVAYYVARLADSLEHFPEQLLTSDVLYVQLMAEEAEALEAQAMAHGLPTPANCEHAANATRDAIALQELECVVLEQQAAGSFTRPMGVPR